MSELVCEIKTMNSTVIKRNVLGILLLFYVLQPTYFQVYDLTRHTQVWNTCLVFAYSVLKLMWWIKLMKRSVQWIGKLPEEVDSQDNDQGE